MTDSPDVGHQPLLIRWHRLIVAAWAVYWVTLTGLLLSPKVPRPPIVISKKGLVVHFTTFAILAYLGALARRSAGETCTRAWALRWWAIFAAFGALTEILQPLSGRHRDIEDFVADALGAGVVLAVVTLRRRGARLEV